MKSTSSAIQVPKNLHTIGATSWTLCANGGATGLSLATMLMRKAIAAAESVIVSFASS
jgi:hypothetical protein